MSELDSTVKSIMDVLGDLDELFDENDFDKMEGRDETIWQALHRRILRELSFVDGDLSNHISLIPGTHPIQCHETLLVCMFPVYNRLGETFPNDVPELRLNDARKYLELCPGTKNVIFYGPLWDSALWNMHKAYFRRCDSFLKLIQVVYTRLRK